MNQVWGMFSENNFLSSYIFQFQTKFKSNSSMVSNILSHSIKMDNSIRLSKINFTTFKNTFIFLIFFSFFSFISKPFSISFQKHFNHFDFSIKTTQPIKLNAIACMHQTCCYLIMYFNLMKNFISYISCAQKFINKSF